MNGIGKMERKKRAYIILLLIPSIVLPIIFTYYPMIKGSIMAFQSYNLMDIGNIRNPLGVRSICFELPL